MCRVYVLKAFERSCGMYVHFCKTALHFLAWILYRVEHFILQKKKREMRIRLLNDCSNLLSNPKHKLVVLDYLLLLLNAFGWQHCEYENTWTWYLMQIVRGFDSCISSLLFEEAQNENNNEPKRMCVWDNVAKSVFALFFSIFVFHFEILFCLSIHIGLHAVVCAQA